MRLEELRDDGGGRAVPLGIAGCCEVGALQDRPAPRAGLRPAVEGGRGGVHGEVLRCGAGGLGVRSADGREREVAERVRACDAADCAFSAASSNHAAGGAGSGGVRETPTAAGLGLVDAVPWPAAIECTRQPQPGRRQPQPARGEGWQSGHSHASSGDAPRRAGESCGIVAGLACAAALTSLRASPMYRSAPVVRAGRSVSESSVGSVVAHHLLRCLLRGLGSICPLRWLWQEQGACCSFRSRARCATCPPVGLLARPGPRQGQERPPPASLSRTSLLKIVCIYHTVPSQKPSASG